MRKVLAVCFTACAGCLAPNPDWGAGVDLQATGSTTGDDTDPLLDPVFDPCPPVEAAPGDAIRVTPSDVSELPGIVQNAAAGTTVLLEPGLYLLEEQLVVGASGMTIRSSTGKPEDVTLDGQRLTPTIFFVQASDVTIAEMTLRRSAGHLIHVSGAPTGDVTGVAAYRVQLQDPGLAALKVNRNGASEADGVSLACSALTVSEAGRAEQAPCEVRGVDAIGVADLMVRDNSFNGFWCPSEVAYAVEVHRGSADSVIERNNFIDCATAIQLGFSETQLDDARPYDGREGCADGYYGHYGGLIRNNMIAATGTGIADSGMGFGSGIGLWQVCNAIVSHNTVVSVIGARSSIEYRFDRTEAQILNNLVSDTIIVRQGARAPVSGNIETTDLSSFVAPLQGDLHLLATSEAVDAGDRLGGELEVPHDIDGDPRPDPPDVGADEYAD